MAAELLLVGSIPLETAEEVFRAFGSTLGPHLAYLPDGEIADRRYWIDGIAYRVLNGHTDLETVRRPKPTADGRENWRPLGRDDQFQFRVRPGVSRVRFGDPGWRLGYTRDAIASYFVFRQLRKEGAIPAHVRFQVCMPLTWSCIGAFFPDPADREKVAPGMTEALAAEVAKIVEKIPPDDLAIQWDLAIEQRYVETALREGGLAAGRAEAARMMAPAAEIAPHIPEAAALGYHACFGTLNGWPSTRPPDLTGTVQMLNEAVAASGRKVDFLHFPTLGDATDAYFAPLGELDAKGARVYVGAIHHLHGAAGLAGQLAAVDKVLKDYGLAAPCGFGRAPERPGRLLADEGIGPPPEIVRTIIDDHLAAAKLLAGR